MANNTVLYGFQDLAKVMASKVTQVGVGVLRDALMQTADEYDRVVREVLAAWCQNTTNGKDLVPSLGTARLQPVGEMGKPLVVQGGAVAERGYPLQDAGHAFGANRVARAYMTVQDLQDEMRRALMADRAWMTDHILAAILDNASWTFTDTALKLGSLTVLPLANGDGELYGRVGTAAASTDGHYLYQANAISDTDNPFTTLYNELIEHPGAGEIVAYISSSLVSTTSALSGFYPVASPFLTPGIAATTTNGLVSRFQGPAARQIGVVGNVAVYEWPSLPSGYILGVGTGHGPFLGWREHVPAELQGFKVMAEENDVNFNTTYAFRSAGFGVRNRIAAAVMLVANGSYAIPSGFDAPLA